MILAITNLIIRIFGVDAATARRALTIFGVFLGVLLFLGAVMTVKDCGKTTAPINEKEIREQKEAIEKHEREKLDNRLQEIQKPLDEANRKVREAEANTNRILREGNRNISEQELRDKLKNL
jgi:rRNA maturation endonuclease Nob1